MVIEKNKQYIIENVLSMRKLITQAEIQTEMVRLHQFILQNDLKPTGPVVTSTYGVKEQESGQCVDFEINIPVNKKIALDNTGYCFKDELAIRNALYYRHNSINPVVIQNSMREIKQYIKDNNLREKNVYTVQLNDIQSGTPVIETYIEVE